MNKKTFIPFILAIMTIVGFLGYQSVNAITSTYTQPLYDSHDVVATADAVTNAYSRDVIGNKTDAAAAGAVSATESIMAYSKQIVTEIGTDGAGLLDLGGMSTAMLGEVQDECTDAIEADSLDKLIVADDRSASFTYPDSVADESIMAFIMSKSASPVKTSYDNTTHSLEAIGDLVTLTAQEAEVEDALQAQNLDHVAGVDTTVVADADLTTYAADGSLLSHIMTAGADTSDYQASTDSLEAISVALLAGTGCTAAIDADALDHIASMADGTDVYPASVVEDSILAKILGDDTTAVATTFDNTTDSLEAIGVKTTQTSNAANPSYGHPNYLAVATGTFDTTGTWSTAASHEIATVTGMVRMTIIAECVTSMSSVADNGTMALGDETTGASIIAASTIGAGAMAAGELWVDATLTRTILTGTQLDAIEFAVAAGKDIGYTVATNALSAGSMIFHIYWTPLDATGAVAAGAGGTL